MGDGEQRSRGAEEMRSGGDEEQEGGGAEKKRRREEENEVLGVALMLPAAFVLLTSG